MGAAMNTMPTKPRRERPKAIKLSDAAAARIREIIAAADGKYAGVRVGVTNGGCAGMSYTMDYADEAKPLEEVVEDKDVKIFIDPKAILFLDRHRDGFRARQARGALCVQQPEPDGRLRLRRVGGDHARQSGLTMPRAKVATKPDGRHFDDLFQEFGPVTLRRFFGGEGICSGEIMLGMVFSDTIYFKTDEITRKAFLAEKTKPFTFLKRSTGETIVTTWFALPDRLYDDPEELAQWARAAYQVALASPTVEKKRRKATKKKRT